MRSRIPKPEVKLVRHLDLRRRPHHRTFIGTLPCLVCPEKAPTECAHVRRGTDGGMGLKPSDRYCVPLCHACHQRQHQIGEVAFWGQVGIDPLDYAKQLWVTSGDRNAALRTVLRARQAIDLKAMMGQRS